MEDLLVLFVFTELPVGIAEDPLLCVLGQESQNALLPPAPFGNIMLFNQGILAMERNGMKVEVKRFTSLQAQFAYSIKPARHELGIQIWIDSATVLSQKAALGHDVQPGEQSQSLIEDVAHDVAVTRRAEQL